MADRPILTQAHQGKLIESAIDPEVALERGYASVAPGDPRLRPFAEYQRATGILMPVRPPDGSNGLYQLRRDYDRLIRDRSGGKDRQAKYELPTGQAHRLDMHPRAQRWKDNPGVTLWVTEGIKKGDALVSLGRCAVALGGVWCFRKECIPDWDLIALRGRVVVIVFDSDAETNPSVAAARDALAAFLTERGARVRIVRLPHGADGKKIGIDDFVAAGGELVELLAKHCTDWVPPAEGTCPREACRANARELTRTRELESLEARIIAAPKDGGLRPNRRLPALLLVRRYYSDARRSTHPEAEPGKPAAWKPSRPVVDGDGWDTINMKRWAGEVGLSDDTLRKTAHELAGLGVLEVDTPRETLPSGQIVTRTKIRPKAGSLVETVRALTTVVQAPSGWGGKRTWRCPDHWEAKIELKRVCAVCGAAAEEVELDATGTQLASRCVDASSDGLSPGAPRTNGTQLASRSGIRPAVPPAGLQLASRLARQRQERETKEAAAIPRPCLSAGCDTALRPGQAFLCDRHRAKDGPSPPDEKRDAVTIRTEKAWRDAGIDVARLKEARAAGVDVIAAARATGVEGDAASFAAAFPASRTLELPLAAEDPPPPID
jgi:hypothetical protein